MRIAVIHSFYSSESPSGENVVVQMQVEALREAGHEVELISANTDDLSDTTGYRIKTALNVMTGGGIDPTEQLKIFSPDVIHIHNLFPNFSTKWMKTWLGPIVATMHNFRPVCSSGILYRNGELCTLCPNGSQWNSVKHACYRGSRIATIPLAIRNRNGVLADPVISRADNLIFLSERSKKTYESFGLSAKVGSILSNFVDTPDFGDKKLPHLGEWIYVGRLAPEKGVVRLLSNWPSSEIINVYGDGPDVNEVMSLAGPNIRIHGLRERSEVLLAIKESKGMVIPSTCAENFPTVYAEALAAGKPVLGRTGNAASDDIALSDSGHVFHEWTDIPEKIRKINAEYETHAMAAALRFDAKFTKTVWIKSITSIYENLVSQ